VCYSWLFGIFTNHVWVEDLAAVGPVVQIGHGLEVTMIILVEVVSHQARVVEHISHLVLEDTVLLDFGLASVLADWVRTC
jgi:hypothetical protein